MSVKRAEVLERLLRKLHHVAELCDTGEAHITVRDEEDQPIAAFIYVNTDPADVQQVLNAVDKVTDSWHTSTASDASPASATLSDPSQEPEAKAIQIPNSGESPIPNKTPSGDD